MSNIDLEWANMLSGITAQAIYLRDTPHVLYRQLSELTLPAKPARVYLTGCGDSWYCGLAARFAFEEWAGIPTEAPQAMEFSRYLVHHAPTDSLVVGISNSGRVSRTIEALRRAGARGIPTLAGTGDLRSEIARTARFAIDLGYAERRFGPGTSSYVASLALLYCLAIRLGEANGRLSSSDAEAKLNELGRLSEPMRATIDAQTPPLQDLGRRAPLTDKVMFLGAGPNYGTALFSVAKMFEAARHDAVGQELEEWAHEQYFVSGPGTYVFVLSPPGASVDRAREQLWAVREIGAVAIAVCDPDDQETAALADIVLPVFGRPSETLSPIVYCVPGELFSYHFAVSKHLRMLGFDDEHRKQVNFRQIFESRVVELDQR